MTSEAASSSTPIPEDEFSRYLSLDPSDDPGWQEWLAEQMLGAERLRERLSGTPFYAKRAAQAAARGNEMDYWLDLLGSLPGSRVPIPRRESSTSETTQNT